MSDEALTYKEMIVQSTVAKRMISTVSPIYEDAYTGCWIYEILGRCWDEVWAIIDELQDELFPETTTWAIELWEERYGITNTAGKTLEQRRAAVIEARSKHLNPRVQIINYLSARTGCDVDIIDNVGLFTFGINISTEDMMDPTFDQQAAQKYIDVRKPSHLSYRFNYHVTKTIQLYVGIALSASCKHTLGPIPMPDLSAEDYLVDELGNYLMDENAVVLTD